MANGFLMYQQKIKEKDMKQSKNNDYITGNLLHHYDYF